MVSDETPEGIRNRSLGRIVAAWGVHLFTASGAVWGLLMLDSIEQERWMAMFGWMTLAVFVDAFDGMLARLVQVKRVLPGFDGTLLDNVIDYLNYVVVPAVFFWRSGLLPPWSAFAVAAAICLTSAYQFCQSDAKTADHYFKGFPSYWNVAALYLFLAELPPWANAVLLAALNILVFVPIKYVYPSRTSLLRRTTLILTILWGALLLAALVVPKHRSWLVGLSWAYVAYYVLLSLYATVKGRRK